jgi:hypothetical protein
MTAPGDSSKCFNNNSYGDEDVTAKDDILYIWTTNDHSPELSCTALCSLLIVLISI